ncbi:hypothetical protein CVT25_015711 [Psilocybe cyanescens]|uniref:F-box domain-containing protein n=1 Tax=Psilocybe cyanescens TaxID=93625 RepID=A0A409X1F5_PSICY|nr:hypothetical protein CVT25_015711 [Psilocybe cyanescens]
MDFPPELINEIFHYGCILSTSFSLALCQISSWTRRLALPYLYSTAVIKKHANTRSLSLALTPKFTPICPPSPHFAPKDSVESLWVEAVSNTIVTIFRSCPNIRNIALPPDNVLWLAYASSQGNQSYTFLPINPSDKPNLHLLLTEAYDESILTQFPYANIALNNPFFDRITHLRIGKLGRYSALVDIAQYENLTHIAIPYHLPQKQSLSDLPELFTFPSVMLLVVVILTDLLSAAKCEEAIAWVRNIRVSNPKVYAVTSQYHNLQAEWEEEVRRGVSIWDKAERFTLAKCS